MRRSWNIAQRVDVGSACVDPTDVLVLIFYTICLCCSQIVSFYIAAVGHLMF